MKQALYSAVVATLLASGSTFAQSSVQPPTGTGYVRFDIFTRGELPSPCTGYSSRTLYQTSGTQSNLTLTQCESFVFVSVNENGSGQTPDIGRIGITGGTPKRRTVGGANQGAVEIVLVSSVPVPSPGQNPIGIPSGLPQPAPVGRDFGGVVAVGSNVSETVPHYELFGRVGRDVKSTGGALPSEVFVNSIAAFWADGDILVPFTFYRARPTLNASSANIVSAKSIQASFLFQSFNNDVVLSGTNGMTLEATDGDIGFPGNASVLLTGVGVVRATSTNPAKGNIYSNLNGSLPSQILATGNFGSPAPAARAVFPPNGLISGGDPDRIDVAGVFRADINSGSTGEATAGRYLSRFSVGTLDGKVNFWSGRVRSTNPVGNQVLIGSMQPGSLLRFRQFTELPVTVQGGVPAGASVRLQRVYQTGTGNPVESLGVTGSPLRAPMVINGDVNGTLFLAGISDSVAAPGSLTINGNINSALEIGALDSPSGFDSGLIATPPIVINGDVSPTGQLVFRRGPGNLRVNGRMRGLFAVTADELPGGSTGDGGNPNPFWGFGTAQALGLDGQIVINTNAPSTQGFTWNTPVYVNGSTTGPSPLIVAANVYPQLSSVLSDDADGGAVGHAPYRLHAQDSLPANDPAWTLSVNPPNQSVVPLVAMGQWIADSSWTTARIRSRFYGPIRTSSVNADVNLREYGVRVQRANLDANGVVLSWSDATGRFTGFVDVDPTRVPNALLSRDFTLRPACGVTPGLYRAIRTNDFNNPARNSRLLSRYTGETRTDPAANTQGDDDFVGQFAHYFRLSGPGDVASANQSVGPDGVQTADDTIVFLSWYFAGDPRADVAGPNQSVGPDGNFTADDIIVFLGWYFADPATFVFNLPSCTLPIVEEEPGPEGGDGLGVSEPMSGGRSAPVGSSAGSSTQAQQIEAMQAMINAETDPQRRAMLQAALAILQAASQVGDDR